MPNCQSIFDNIAISVVRFEDGSILPIVSGSISVVRIKERVHNADVSIIVSYGFITINIDAFELSAVTDPKFDQEYNCSPGLSLFCLNPHDLLFRLYCSVANKTVFQFIVLVELFSILEYIVYYLQLLIALSNKSRELAVEFTVNH